MPFQRLGRRERMETKLRIAAEAGDATALTKLQHMMADRLAAAAEKAARRESLRKWRMGAELSRPPLVPDHAPDDAVLTELPRTREAYPRLSRHPFSAPSRGSSAVLSNKLPRVGETIHEPE